MEGNDNQVLSGCPSWLSFCLCYASSSSRLWFVSPCLFRELHRTSEGSFYFLRSLAKGQEGLLLSGMNVSAWLIFSPFRSSLGLVLFCPKHLMLKFRVLIHNRCKRLFLRGAPFFGSACSSVSVLTLFCSLHRFCVTSPFSVPTENHFLYAALFRANHLSHTTHLREHALFPFVLEKQPVFLFVSHKIRAFLQWLSAAKISHPLCSYTTSRGLPLYRTELHVCAC